MSTSTMTHSITWHNVAERTIHDVLMNDPETWHATRHVYEDPEALVFINNDFEAGRPHLDSDEVQLQAQQEDAQLRELLAEIGVEELAYVHDSWSEHFISALVVSSNAEQRERLLEIHADLVLSWWEKANSTPPVGP